MEKKFGGQMTRGGVYLSLRTGEVVALPREGGELPGRTTVPYVRIPTALGAVLGPLVGLAYVIFLPFIGLAMITWFAGRQAARGIRALGRRSAELVTAGWQPGLSYFVRRRQRGEKGKGR